MQLLGLYVAVLPALRHRQSRRVYSWWAWMLASGGFGCVVVAGICYMYAMAIAPLIRFLRNALQAFMILQLI